MGDETTNTAEAAPEDQVRRQDRGDGEGYGYGQDEDDGQEYVDRSVIDFDPKDGLYSGTAVDGTTDIPGPHELGDDVTDADGDDATEGEGSDPSPSDGG